MAHAIRVMLADDHPLFRQGVAHLLSGEPDMTVVAQAASGHEAVMRAALGDVDVVVMDLSMPDLNGIEATRTLAETHPSVRVLVLSGREDTDSLFAAIEAGAAGYVPKDVDPAELLRSIRIVASGGSVLSPSITPQLLAGVRAQGYEPVESERRRLSLTERELEIIVRLRSAGTPAQIGRELFISTKTVQNHISNIYRKLEVKTRNEAIVRCMELGLLPRE